MIAEEVRRVFARELVLEVYLELARWFDPAPAWEALEAPEAVRCPHALADRLCAVGGFRRGKVEMKDLELLYIPRVVEVEDPADLFGAKRQVDVTERLIEGLRAEGILAPRLDAKGHVCWGARNKHAVHVASGLPIDLFAASHENYFNRLVVTTGPVELNIRIAQAARAKKYEWEVYQAGFVPLGGSWEGCPTTRRVMGSEAAVFEFVGMKWMRPEERK